MTEPSPKTPSDHDLLIRIDERVKDLGTSMTNHLRHHRRWSFMVATAVVGTVGTVLVLLIKSIMF